MAKIPAEFHNLFWDVDPSQLDLKANKAFVISRILEKGNFHSLRWLLSTYTITSILDIINTKANITNPTFNFWTQLLPR